MNRNNPTLIDFMVWFAIGILVVMVLIIATYEFTEYDRGKMRDITKQSLEYSESQVTQLQTLHDVWLGLETDKLKTDNTQLETAYIAQQVAIVERMRVIENRLPNGYEYPAHLSEFLDTH